MNLETFFLFNWPVGLQEIIKSNKVKSKFIDRKSYFDGWDMILPFLNHVLSKIYEYQFNNAVNFHYTKYLLKLVVYRRMWMPIPRGVYEP